MDKGRAQVNQCHFGWKNEKAVVILVLGSLLKLEVKCRIRFRTRSSI